MSPSKELIEAIYDTVTYKTNHEMNTNHICGNGSLFTCHTTIIIYSKTILYMVNKESLLYFNSSNLKNEKQDIRGFL